MNKIKNDVKTMKKFLNNLPVVLNYISSSQEYFRELKNILENVELNDKDKIIMINNQFKEFEAGVLNG